MANNTAASSSSTVPNTQSDPLPSATGNSAPNHLREKPKEPEFVANIEGLCHEKLRVWSSDVGEVWFHPKENFHLSNVRAATVATGPTGRVTIALAFGDSQYWRRMVVCQKFSPQGRKYPAPRKLKAEDPPGMRIAPTSIEVSDVPWKFARRTYGLAS